MRWVVRLVLAWVAVVALARADERILSFDSAIAVQRDGTLEVRETIRVRAEGNRIKRGIYRDFPTVYPAKDGRQIVVGFGFESATRDGNAETWRIEERGNGKRIYLGSASVLLPAGEHTYEIVYRTDRQMGFFSEHDELYWNVNGNGWDFAIDRVTARVTLPSEIPPADIRMEAYTGAQGSAGKDYSAELEDGTTAVFASTRAFGPREGLTIVAMWPKGFIIPAVPGTSPPLNIASQSVGYDAARDGGQPSNYNENTYSSPAEAFLRREFARDNRPVLFGFAGLALIFLFYWRVWSRIGRDPPSKGIIPEYESPKDVSAASMRYLLRMGYDNECYAAAVLSLAVKGSLRIEQDSGILGFGKKYTLVRSTKDPDVETRLAPDESALLGALFVKGDRIELKQENHVVIRGASRLHEGALKSGYATGYFRLNGGWNFLGILLTVFAIAVTMSQPGTIGWPLYYLDTKLGWLTAALAIATLAVALVFGWLLRAPTVRGQALMDKIRGFKKYLEVAEGADLKRISGPPPKLTPALYEAYLPAALALDVDQRWAEKFARVLAVEAPNYQPAWYTGSAFNVANVAGFSSQLSSSLTSAISSSSSAPGSKSGGGGGGSSGGGGGGGGGGGW
ncbi:MAG: DUF2207 domain-containing protein [Steroidobacteraceae bacterium]|nr:DUF2207 domain-containing protein [Steroidobacteraceae bacterium]